MKGVFLEDQQQQQQKQKACKLVVPSTASFLEVLNMSAETLATYSNKEVIQVSQATRVRARTKYSPADEHGTPCNRWLLEENHRPQGGPVVRVYVGFRPQRGFGAFDPSAVDAFDPCRIRWDAKADGCWEAL